MSVMEQEMFCVAARLDSGDESIPAVAACNMMRNAPSIEQAFARLNRYENSIRRAYHQALTQLRVTQTARKRLQDDAQEAQNTACDSNPPAHQPEPTATTPDPVVHPPTPRHIGPACHAKDDGPVDRTQI
jgi:hypothetical protein